MHFDIDLPEGFEELCERCAKGSVSGLSGADVAQAITDAFVIGYLTGAASLQTEIDWKVLMLAAVESRAQEMRDRKACAS